MKISRLKLRTIFSTIILIVALFFPSRGYTEYHVILLLLVLSVGIVGAKIFGFGRSQATNLLFGFVVYIFVLGVIVGMIQDVDVQRNASEFIRFAPVLFLLMFARSFSFNEKNIFFVILPYLCLSAAISIFQAFRPEAVEMVTRLYVSEHHIQVGGVGRASGLSSGPGQNGAIMVMLFAMSYAVYLTSDRPRSMMYALAGCFLSAITIIFSQSQTAFIVLCGVLLYGLIFKFRRVNLKKSKIAIASYAIAASAFIWLVIAFIWDDLTYTQTLFQYGLERSSYVAREEKVSNVLEASVGNIAYLFFGHGKDFWGIDSSSFDNEYLFFVAVYGLFATLVILGVYLHLIITGIRAPLNKIAMWTQVLHFMVIAGIILSWPSSFLLDPRLIFLVGVAWIANNATPPLNRLR